MNMIGGSPTTRRVGPLARATMRSVKSAGRLAALMLPRPGARAAAAEPAAHPGNVRRLFRKLTRNRNTGRITLPAMTLTLDAAPVRPLPQFLPAVLASAGNLRLRLADGAEDVAAAQALRYRVFYEEMSAQPTPEMRRLRRDYDAFDSICDILLVEDATRPAGERTVGTYRLLRQDVAERTGGFYSETEFDLGGVRKLFGSGRQGLELGRSCVDRAYRNNATIQLLWRGIAAYLAAHRIGWMFGCASLHGTDPDGLAPQLSFLHHNFLAPPELRARALEHRYVEMARLPREALQERRVLASLPPLVKGYLRLGAYVGEGAVVDHQFGTTDVFVLVPLERIGQRYFQHFDKDEQVQSIIGNA